MIIQLIDRFNRLTAVGIKRYSVPLLRWSLVMVLIWSGLLAIVQMNASMTLIVRSIPVPVDLGVGIGTEVGVVILGIWEIGMGLGLTNDQTAPLAAIAMIGYVAVTMVPLFVVPTVTFARFPVSFTLAGAYIIKNWALLGGAITIGGVAD